MVHLTPQNIPYEPLSASTKATLLESAPDCAHFLSDPALRPLYTLSRKPKSSTEDSLIAETLFTDRTVRLWQSFYKEPPRPDPLADAQDRPPSDPLHGEIVTLVLFGDGLNGHPEIMHGGIVSTVLDETLGAIAGFHAEADKAGFTVFLNVKFKKPVPAPGTVVCRAWLERRTGGRKLWVRGVIEDVKGTVLAEAESLFLEVDRVAKL